jgi:hypothetical protein
MAVQETSRLSFGPGRVYIQPNGTTTTMEYGAINDIQFDIKSNQKPIYTENGFPLAIFDGHKEITISIKHYKLGLTTTAFDLNQAAPVASTTTWAFDEIGTIATHAYTLANGATYQAGTLSLAVWVTNAGVTYPVPYAIVTGGTEVAGKSASVSGSGVVTFASGETATTCVATYSYGLTTGNKIAIVNQYQNSSPSFKMYYIKRDRSQIDNSTGVSAIIFNAVRFGGMKWGYTDDKEMEVDRSLMAFADPVGNIGEITYTNY